MKVKPFFTFFSGGGHENGTAAAPAAPWVPIFCPNGGQTRAEGPKTAAVGRRPQADRVRFRRSGRRTVHSTSTVT